MQALKHVGKSGQLTLGKRFAGRSFLMEEKANGEVVFHPVKVLCTEHANFSAEVGGFRIAEVDQVILPSREERNARG